ncbi:sigma-70 family RNA polymerase sigma factor [Oceanirhabdus sp. W0125-5]|uniref:sigma-70 family RNA polymerase sigma factor n=1 Tax=Oceanirhabdus sp. W0125-5 TaxID=2999116 RepID=UPI0022F2E91C|nr:sigma-70 family RNA polymerase sigma factor [Oceanirhabdus sp. W0125-5]WBW98218.1 sigma-70 family RNA polymerase sigma factor [Oceanirhabdus sp. W0125-5]
MSFLYSLISGVILEPFKRLKFNKEKLNKENRDKFIKENKSFIYKSASSICNRKLSWENDDELSIAMIAFNKSCDVYEDSRGNFYSFSRMVIRNSIYDYFRKKKNTPYLTFQKEDEDFDYIDVTQSISEHEKKVENNNRADEISILKDELSKYDISFDTLISASPKHKDTRDHLLNLAFSCAKDDTIVEHIKTKKRLPAKKIIDTFNEKRKFIERWRNYLLTLIIVLSNDEYIHVRTYLNIKAGDNND